jgi:hypothetical protein
MHISKKVDTGRKSLIFPSDPHLCLKRCIEEARSVVLDNGDITEVFRYSDEQFRTDLYPKRYGLLYQCLGYTSSCRRGATKRSETLEICTKRAILVSQCEQAW